MPINEIKVRKAKKTAQELERSKMTNIQKLDVSDQLKHIGEEKVKQNQLENINNQKFDAIIRKNAMSQKLIQDNYIKDFAEIRNYFKENPGVKLSDKTDDINAHHLLDKYNKYTRVAGRQPGTTRGIGARAALYNLELLEVFYRDKFKKPDKPRSQSVNPFNKKTATIYDLDKMVSPNQKQRSSSVFGKGEAPFASDNLR